MARPDKEASVAAIAERFNDSDAALLTEYRGLRVSEIAEVRNALRESDTDYKVLKNTLARIAVREVGLEELIEMLTGPTAIAFIKGDAAAAAKALDEASKKFPVLAVKGGVLNGKVISADQAKELARLEPREVLLAKIAMLMNTPAQQTVTVFAALLRDFGSMLAQVAAKKESGELPGGTGEAPADETPETPETAAETPEAETAPAEDAAPAEAPAAEASEEGAPEVTAEPVEAEGAEQAVEAAAEETSTAADETEAAAEAATTETPAEEAATEAEPPAEVAEAVDQAPAAPESDAAESQEIKTDETEATKEEE